MKAILITYNQAYYDEIAKVLNDNGVKGFTEWNEIKGHGSDTGEPHYGTHAWPTLNSAVLAFVPDEKVRPLLHDIHELDVSAPQQGLRAFVLNAEEVTDKDL